MSSDIAAIVLAELIGNAEYATQVLPHLNVEFFESGNQCIFEAISEHFARYENCPSRQQVGISISNTRGIPPEKYDAAVKRLKEMAAIEPCTDSKWLLDRTEEFIAEGRRHGFVLDLIHKLDAKKPPPSPEEYAQATTFSFFKPIGHDLFRDWQLLHDHMTDANERFPFDLPELNRMTNGGVTRKTLMSAII